MLMCLFHRQSATGSCTQNAKVKCSTIAANVWTQKPGLTRKQNNWKLLCAIGTQQNEHGTGNGE